MDYICSYDTLCGIRMREQKEEDQKNEESRSDCCDRRKKYSSHQKLKFFNEVR